jgi:hypothetical protein
LMKAVIFLTALIMATACYAGKTKRESGPGNGGGIHNEGSIHGKFAAPKPKRSKFRRPKK